MERTKTSTGALKTKTVALLFLAGMALQCKTLFACSVCEKQQPRILRGITHGAGPQGKFDYVIIWIMVAVTLATLYYSVKWLVRPGERSRTHIKRFILNDE